MTDIISLRRDYNNKCYTKIKSLSTSIIRDRETIERLRHGIYDKNFSTTKIQKLKDTILNKETEIEELKLDIDNTTKGDNDENLLSEVENDNEQFLKKNNNSVMKKTQKKKEKEDKNKKLQDYFQNIRDTRKNERRTKYNMKKEYYYYLKNSDRLPRYMKKNLKNMPSNKGYKWNDIIFFGEKPSKHMNPTVIFEKNKSTLYIHEWKGNTTKVYKKEQNKKNELVSTHVSRLKPPF